VAVVLRTNRTLATNIHGEASTTLRRFHSLINSTQSTSKHSINTSQLAAASGHRSPVLDSDGYIQSAHFGQGLILHIPTPSKYYIPSLIRSCTLSILISEYYRSTAQRSYTAHLQELRTFGIYMTTISTLRFVETVLPCDLLAWRAFSFTIILSLAFIAGREELREFFFWKCVLQITLLPAHARIALFLQLAFGSGLATRFHFVI